MFFLGGSVLGSIVTSGWRGDRSAINAAVDADDTHEAPVAVDDAPPAVDDVPEDVRWDRLPAIAITVVDADDAPPAVDEVPEDVRPANPAAAVVDVPAAAPDTFLKLQRARGVKSLKQIKLVPTLLKCMKERYSNSDAARNRTRIVVSGNSVMRKFYYVLSAFINSHDRWFADRLATRTRAEEKKECHKGRGTACASIVRSGAGHTFEILMHWEQRIWSPSLERYIREAAPDVVILNAGLDDFLSCNYTAPPAGQTCDAANATKSKGRRVGNTLSNLATKRRRKQDYQRGLQHWRREAIAQAQSLRSLMWRSARRRGTAWVWRDSVKQCGDRAWHHEVNAFLERSTRLVRTEVSTTTKPGGGRGGAFTTTPIFVDTYTPSVEACDRGVGKGGGYADAVHPSSTFEYERVKEIVALLCDDLDHHHG